MILDFTEAIEKLGFDASKSRLARHDYRIARERAEGKEYLDHDVSLQRSRSDPYNGADFIFQFIPGISLASGDQTALFVAAHRILNRRNYDGSDDGFALYHPDAGLKPWSGGRIYDLEAIQEFEEFSERILIRWGSPASTRAWSQWAERQRKEVVELRMSATQPGFPGFSRFASSIEELLLLPQPWRAALASVKGVYLLVCPDTGDQYVGSAYGEDGFWGRWMAYADNGHGGNLLLRQRDRTNYALTILEVASPDMSSSEIIQREGAWKEKLGSRAHGLNAN
jgi:hypothetical protein